MVGSETIIYYRAGRHMLSVAESSPVSHPQVRSSDTSKPTGKLNVIEHMQRSWEQGVLEE
jgi:hypothetical protein